MIFKLVGRTEVLATITGGVQLALAEDVAAAPSVGFKQGDTIKSLTTGARGVQFSLADAIAAALTVDI